MKKFSKYIFLGTVLQLIGFATLGIVLLQLSKKVETIKTDLDFDNQYFVSIDGFLDRRINELDARISFIDQVASFDSRIKTRLINIKLALRETSAASITKLSGRQRDTIAHSIVKWTDKYDIPTNIFLGLMRTESAFNIKAISSVGAKGLTQVMDYTAKDIQTELSRIDGKYVRYKPYNIDSNIRFGAFYLSEMLSIFDGDIDLALSAYNAGPRKVALWHMYTQCIEQEKEDCGEEVSLRKETIDYVPKIKAFATKYIEDGVF